MTRFSTSVNACFCATAVAFILAIIFMSAACLAADVPDKLPLADAVAMALDGNPNLRSAENARTNSLSKLRIANLTTSFDFGTTSTLERAADDHSRLFSNFDYTNLLGTMLELNIAPLATGSDKGDINLSLRHPLKRGKGKLSSKSDLVLGARSDADIQEKELYLTTQATVLGVVNAYYGAMLTRERVQVQEEAVSIARETADGAGKRAKEGLVAEVEVSRAEIRVAQTENELNTRRQDALAAMDALMIAIGSGIGQKPELTEPFPEPEMIGTPPDLAAAMEIALKNRSELAVYDTNLSELSRKLAIAQDQLRPGLDLVANYGSSSSNNGWLSHSIWDNDTLTGGLEYKLPLDRRALLEEQSMAENSLQITRRLRTFQMEQIAKEVRDAHREFEKAKTSLDIFGQNLAVAQDNLRMAKIRVDEGITDNQEVLNAQESLTQVQDGLVSAKVNLYLAGVNLKSAMGEDLSVVGGK